MLDYDMYHVVLHRSRDGQISGEVQISPPFSSPEPLVLTFMYLDEKNDKKKFFFFWLIEQVLI